MKFLSLIFFTTYFFTTSLFASEEILLTGTITGNKSIAILKFKSKTHFLKVGSTIGGWVIKDIQAKKVILANRKKTEVIRAGEYVMRHDSPLKAVKVRHLGDKIHIDLDKVGQQHIIKNAEAFALEATAEEVQENGEVVGFKVWNFDHGSVWNLAGFLEGDVVTHIDGSKIDSARVGLQKLNSVKSKKQFDVVIRRGRETKTMKVKVVL